MKKNREDTLRRLSGLWRDSSSKEEFGLKVAIEGGAGFWPSLLFRAYLFRKRHPVLVDGSELALVGIGAFGFLLWGVIVGHKNTLAGIGIMLLTQAVMVPLALALCGRFDRFCRRMNAMEESMK